MTPTKRQFLKSAAALGMVMTLGISPANAQGGDDPIGGIDIIVKKDPASRPVAEISFSGREVKQFNQLKGRDRSAYLAKVLAPHLAKFGEGRTQDEWAKVLAEALGNSWCGPCRTGDKNLTRTVKFKDGISAFITATF